MHAVFTQSEAQLIGGQAVKSRAASDSARGWFETRNLSTWRHWECAACDDGDIVCDAHDGVPSEWFREMGGGQMARKPPSIASSVPVTKLLSSLAR